MPKKTKEVAINIMPETTLPRFSNLITASTSKERGEVILDFLFVDERLKNKEGKVVGNPIARIALTLNTAKELVRMLGKLSGKK